MKEKNKNDLKKIKFYLNYTVKSSSSNVILSNFDNDSNIIIKHRASI
jgi:hypothetical protein